MSISIDVAPSATLVIVHPGLAVFSGQFALASVTPLVTQAASMAHLLFDLILLAYLSGFVARISTVRGPLDAILRQILFCILAIGLLATVLGYAGMLYPFVLTGFLALTAGGVHFWDRRRTGSPLVLMPTRAGMRSRFGLGGNEAKGAMFRDWTGLEKLLAGSLALFLLVQLVCAIWHTPMEYDSISYRLSRIGWWLQEGSIRQTDLIDSRLNFMPALADLHMLWITGHWFVGYPGTALPQWVGGVMLLASAYGLVRAEGGSRKAGVLAGWFVAGMPLAASQFATDQTDLFTAGLFTTGLLLLRTGFLERRFDPWSGLAFGLAFAAKPTVIFAVPGLCLWCLWVWWMAGRPSRSFALFGATAVLCAAVLNGPRMVENRMRYGSFLSSPQVSQDYLRPELNLKGFAVNLKTSALQLATPGPFPEFLRQHLSALMSEQAALLPKNDPDQVPGQERTLRINLLAENLNYSTDTAPPGPVMTLAPLLVLFVGSIRWLSLSPKARAAIFGGAAATLLFACTFLFLSRWHPYWFRFLNVPAVWLAVSLALVLDGSGLFNLSARVILWAVSLGTATLTWLHTNESGLTNLRPNNSGVYRGISVVHGKLMDALSDHEPMNTTLLLPFNSLISGFFRTDSFNRVLFASAQSWEDPDLTPEKLAGPEGGWVITTPNRFKKLPPTGPVLGFGLGNEYYEALDLACYRVGPGAPPPQAWVRRAHMSRDKTLITMNFEVLSPVRDTLRLVVRNRNAFPIALEGGSAIGSHLLPAGQTFTKDLSLPLNQPVRYRLVFQPSETPTTSVSAPSVSFEGALNYLHY